MHIPSGMVQGVVCPVTLAAGAAGCLWAASLAGRQADKPALSRFAAVTSVIFALQMLNFPVQDGTSGHLLGGALAAYLLGIPFGVMSLALVLAVQSFVFGDGGVMALGANVVNMALVGVVVAGLLRRVLSAGGVSEWATLAVASWFSIVFASLACAFEVASSGVVSLDKVFPAMFSVHALIGIGEAVLTVAVVAVLKSVPVRSQHAAFGLAVLAVLLSPLASSAPDGLEWVAEKLMFVQSAGGQWAGLLGDYSFPGVIQGGFSTVLSGLAGVAIISGVLFLARSLSMVTAYRSRA